MSDQNLLLPKPDGKDYQKLMEKYQDKFNKAYLKSVSLWKAEKIQRQALYAYKRRVNAVLDMLISSEQELDLEDDDKEYLQKDRIENLMKENPKLKNLAKIVDLNDTTELPSKYRQALYLNESIPETIGDELDHLETNPQETEAWVRRQYPHLVTSKFKPLVTIPTGVNNSGEVVQSRNIPKRKRKSIDDNDNDSYTKSNAAKSIAPATKKQNTSKPLPKLILKPLSIKPPSESKTTSSLLNSTDTAKASSNTKLNPSSDEK